MHCLQVSHWANTTKKVQLCWKGKRFLPRRVTEIKFNLGTRGTWNLLFLLHWSPLQKSWKWPLDLLYLQKQMLAVRHKLFASKRAGLNCGLLRCYLYRTGTGKKQNTLWSNSLLAHIREPGTEKRDYRHTVELVDVMPQTALIKELCYCQSVCSPTDKACMHHLDSKASFGLLFGCYWIKSRAILFCAGQWKST